MTGGKSNKGMNEIKIIRTKEDYDAALKLIESLVDIDPMPESEEGERLALLTTLVKDYESRVFPESLPDPIEAIKFRMEQAGLKPADLVPYLGSRSRVSEILSGKRQLTVDMMRALETGLGIPAKVLLKKPAGNEDPVYSNWDNRLVKEMDRRGYFEAVANDTTSLIKSFFSPVCSPVQLVGMLRQSSYRTSPLTDRHALSAWSAYVLKEAKKIKDLSKYKAGTVNLEFMRNVASLSLEEKGPLVAKDFLEKHGIVLVVEPHFARTYLDGATLLFNKDNPVIGLTLRYDRLDNFWFTLMHELAHIALHSDTDTKLFYDELQEVKDVEIDAREHDADNLAEEALIPSNKWEKSPAKRVPSRPAAQALAKDVGVNVAIVAGIIMYKHKRFYTDLNKITNEAKVRQYFADTNWQK